MHEHSRRALVRNLSFVLLATVSVCGCGADRADDVWVDGDTIHINGSLTQATFEKFSAVLEPNIEELSIRSGGGDSLAASAIGRMVVTHDLEVIVNGACLSGCAHFIFLPARRRRFASDSLVVFHNTSSSI